MSEFSSRQVAEVGAVESALVLGGAALPLPLLVHHAQLVARCSKGGAQELTNPYCRFWSILSLAWGHTTGWGLLRADDTTPLASTKTARPPHVVRGRSAPMGAPCQSSGCTGQSAKDDPLNHACCLHITRGSSHEQDGS